MQDFYYFRIRPGTDERAYFRFSAKSKEDFLDHLVEINNCCIYFYGPCKQSYYDNWMDLY